jgi:electron transfer flavoprotein beta subunit
MRIVVCVKAVASLADGFQIAADGRAVNADDLEFALNEWDACGVEEALRVREQFGAEVLAVTVGEEFADPALRRCVAMGADRAVRVHTDAQDPLSVARALADAIDDGAELVICGAQSADLAQGAVGSALAAYLGYPIVAVAKRLDIQDGGSSVEVERELEGGVAEVLATSLPLVVTVQTGINEPRYVNMRAIKRAEAHELEILAPASRTPVASTMRRISVPRSQSNGSDMGTDAGDVARRIAEIVGEKHS